MRTRDSGVRDRILAAVEITALGLWTGALTGFAFIEAPLAFHTIAATDVNRFAALIAATITQLTVFGYVLGGIALLAAIARAVTAAWERRYDMIRAVLIAFGLALSAYHQSAIVGTMERISDVTSPAYHALHGRSSTIYGLVLLLALAALVMSAARARDV